jgi:hypothetical protein
MSDGDLLRSGFDTFYIMYQRNYFFGGERLKNVLSKPSGCS